MSLRLLPQDPFASRAHQPGDLVYRQALVGPHVERQRALPHEHPQPIDGAGARLSRLPQEPGLGLNLDRAAIAKYAH